MWNYEKRLEFPVNIKNPNPKMAQLIISQFGGPNCRCVKILKRLQFFDNSDILRIIGLFIGGQRKLYEDHYCRLRKSRRCSGGAVK